ncbi:hypothetical protein JCM10207_007285 [Rhodosporidiobolus poonsookiae]
MTTSASETATEWSSTHLSVIPPTLLSYSIHSCSGHHSNFVPQHILTHKPGDDASRWTAPPPEDRRQQARRTGSQTRGRREPEWVMLELDEPALVSEIVFGKTTKPHPCNLSLFTLWGGPTPDPLSMEPLVVDGTLVNDNKDESVRVPVEVGRGEEGEEDDGAGTAPIPIKYLKLDCHLASNANYSISIWHLSLRGFPPSYLSSLSPLPSSFPSTFPALLGLYTAHRQRRTTHAMLAHLRRAGPPFKAAFDALLAASDPATQSTFEHPLLSELHGALVGGDYDAAEAVLDRALTAAAGASGAASKGEVSPEEGLFRLWGALAPPGQKRGVTVAKWERLLPPSPGAGEWPKGRGGHALVRVGRKLVLFGGWDGQQDLGDTWEWDLPLTPVSYAAGDRGGPWRRVGKEGERDGGRRPTARSCHQFVADEGTGWVYLLGGRRDDPADAPFSAAAPSSANPAGAAPIAIPAASTAASGAEGQAEGMDLDPSTSSSSAAAGAGEEQEQEQGEEDDPWKSDFWRYKATGPDRGRWECLSEDTRRDGGPQLLFDHSMSLHSATQRLYVFGGKNQPYAPDLEPDSPSDVEEFLAQAAARHERYSGLWVYEIGRGRWSHLFSDPRPSLHTPPLNPSTSDRLLSRAGHALVLDPGSAGGRHPTLYIHSGQRHETYLQDLWAVRIASAADVAGKGRRRGRQGAAGEEEEEEEEEEESDEEASLWRQGAVLDLPPLHTLSSASSGSRRSPPAVPTAVNRSLIDLAALPASPESSPSRAPPSAHASGGRTGTGTGPTILQIRRLWPPTSSSSSSSSSSATGTGASAPTLPPPAFTHRLTLDPHTREWTLLTGLVRVALDPREAGTVAREGTMEGVWRRRAGSGSSVSSTAGSGSVGGVGGRGGAGKGKGGKEGQWEKVEEEWGVVSSDGGERTPRGRYASQVVYDPLLREHYLFGGHPGVNDPNCTWRLDDFWKLRIVDPSPEEALRQAKFLVRKQRFTELCATAPTVLALSYLQTSLSSVVDHSSPTESAAFRACMTAVLSAPARFNVEVDVDMDGSFSSSSGSASGSGAAGGGGGGEEEGADEARYAERHALFEQLCAFFPRSERQPEEDLEDTGRLVRLWKRGGSTLGR